MTPLHPVTLASRNQALDLAKAIIAAAPDFYGKAPVDLVALQVRDWQRLCEDAGIWEPTDIALIVKALFRPAPDLLPKADLHDAIAIINRTAAAPGARARMVVLNLTGVSVPMPPINDTPRP
jgi:hypothetical protein